MATDREPKTRNERIFVQDGTYQRLRYIAEAGIEIGNQKTALRVWISATPDSMVYTRTVHHVNDDSLWLK